MDKEGGKEDTENFDDSYSKHIPNLDVPQTKLLAHKMKSRKRFAFSKIDFFYSILC